MAKNGLIKQANINVSVREQDFVTVFNDNWNALRDILGIMRPIKKDPGTKLTSYKVSVTLADGNVGEGEEIPYSGATIVPVVYDDIKIEKYAKATSIEAVAKYGADVAIEKTDAQFRTELQNNVLTDFYTFLKTGTLTGNATTWQMALAMAKGKVIDKFQKMRKTVTEVVGFANVLDLYEHLGGTDISVQTLFGLTYVTNFMGYKTLFLLSEPDIPKGTVIAIPTDNIDLYYIDPSDSDFAKLGLQFTVDGETNLIGYHAEGNYNTAVGEVFAIMGMKLWAEYIDGIAIETVGTDSISLDKTEVTVAPEATTTLVATTSPAGATVTWESSDETVATVSNGTVTGVAEGTATITATNGTASANCLVTVSAGV